MEVERFELTSIKDVLPFAVEEDLVNELRDSTTFGEWVKVEHIDLFFKLAGHPVIESQAGFVVRRIKLEPGELAEQGAKHWDSDIGFASGLTFYEDGNLAHPDKTAVLTLKQQASDGRIEEKTFLDVIMPVVNGKRRVRLSNCMWVKPTEEGWQWLFGQTGEEKEVITVARESISTEKERE
ncbi:hypothetical protein SPFM1_00055 [Salmonella phage SPFM1]|nr:hypothetical protein SPFM1_00055 [Salmonella phage SPFM1]